MQWAKTNRAISQIVFGQIEAREQHPPYYEARNGLRIIMESIDQTFEERWYQETLGPLASR